jgi:hypothetical protein
LDFVEKPLFGVRVKTSTKITVGLDFVEAWFLIICRGFNTSAASLQGMCSICLSDLLKLVFFAQLPSCICLSEKQHKRQGFQSVLLFLTAFLLRKNV